MRSVLILFYSTLAVAGEYTTYVGDAYPRSVAAIATDAADNTYVVGNRAASGTPTAVIIAGSPISIVPNGPVPPNDVFVSKVDPTGKVLFTSSFAGKGVDQGLAVAVDPSGNIYVAGTTTSPDFPISNALQSQAGLAGAGFIVKLSADGKTILYSTYFGGLQGQTWINAITTDPAGTLYLTGATAATDFPITTGLPLNPFPQYYVGTVAFVTRISPSGDKILFSHTIGTFGVFSCAISPRGCTMATSGIAITLDGAGNVFFGGNTNSAVATTPGALVRQGEGAFSGKIAANGILSFLTYLSPGTSVVGTYFDTHLSSLAADNAGNLYVAGFTSDPKFPVTPGAYQSNFSGPFYPQYGVPMNGDGFVAKLKPDGSGVIWATYLGGSASDAVKSIAVDAAGNVWATGTTASPNFPNTQGWSTGGDFLVELNPAGSSLIYSARYPDGTVSQAVALDSTLFVHTAGVTGILSQIGSTGPPSAKVFGIGNAAGGPLAGRVSPAEVISIYGPHIGPATPITPGSTATYPAILAGVQMTIGGIAAPMLYVSETQINAVVPMGVMPQAAATIRIANGSVTTADYPVWIDSSDPGVFNGVRNQDSSLNSPTHPAKANSVVSFYATGWQSDFSPLTDGQVGLSANNVCTLQICSVSQGSIVYGGAAPGIVAGVTQFNLQLNGGSQPVKVTALQQVTILVKGLNQIVTIWVTP